MAIDPADGEGPPPVRLTHTQQHATSNPKTKPETPTARVHMFPMSRDITGVREGV